MAGEPRYVFGDLITGQIYEEIPCEGVSVNMTLQGGEFRGSFGLDLTGKNNEDIVNATIPGKTFVVMEVGDVVQWGGMVWSRTYQSQAKVAQLYAKTLDQYPSKRIVETDKTWVGIDARQVFLDLYTDMQADPYSLKVDLPAGSYSGLEVASFATSSSELQTYRTAMDSAANTTDGFEWTIDWQRIGNSYKRTLRIGTPLGQPESSYSVVFEYPGNILNYWRNDTIGTAGTSIYGVGAGEGTDMGIIEVVHADLLSGGFPRYDQVISFKDISDVDRLQALTEKQAQIYKAPQPVYTVEMKADREPMFGDWSIGDYCRLELMDPLHPLGSRFSTRIIAWEYTPPQSSAASEVRLTFQGDEGS
jgi:hypothetical protein